MTVLYEDIPREARDLLDETYRPLGVETAWNIYIGPLGGVPRDLWKTQDGRRIVRRWAESLTGMIAT